MVETSQHRFLFHFLGSYNLTINFLQKPKTTYEALVFIDRHLVSVISVKLEKGVQTAETETEYLVKNTDRVIWDMDSIRESLMSLVS